MIPILDAGHGGVVGGEYQTSGKRSPEWDKGVLFEGAFNRWVVHRLMEKMDRQGLPYYSSGFSMYDTSLDDRVNNINNVYSKQKNVYLISVHANAGGGSGMEIYTTAGNTKSDIIASKIIEHVETEAMPIRADWSDGDVDKEANFYILRKSKCPAVLLEVGFMDNKRDYDILWDENFLNLLTDKMLLAAKYLYEHGDTL